MICLLSALRFHRLTTQYPFEVWMAIGIKAWRPRSGHPPLRHIFLSPESLAEGVEEHKVDGVKVKVFSAARTVARGHRRTWQLPCGRDWTKCARPAISTRITSFGCWMEKVGVWRSNTSSAQMSLKWNMPKTEMQKRHIVFQDEDKETYIGEILVR